MDELRAALWRSVRQWDGFIALGFGSGLAPKAPGTFGTLAAIPFGLLLSLTPMPVHLALLGAAFALGVLVCDRVGKRLGVSDHGAMVWDEFVGYWIAIVLLPVQWPWWLAAFVVFRFFDILKPWPIRPLEKAFDGVLGVMLDDVAAGLLTLLILWPLAKWLGA